MRMRLHWLVALVILFIPITGSACEPIIPMFQLLSGPSAAGATILRQSLVWLAVAVAIKCAAFVFLERRLPWRRAVIYMLLANVLSTIPGVFVAACTSSVFGFILALPVVSLLGLLVGRRLTGQKNWSRIGGAGAIAVAFAVFFFVSVLMYGLADSALDNRSFGSYWALKFLFVTLVAFTGILISAVLEECVVARLSRKLQGDVSFFTSVFRANYITLGFVLFVAALEMLPKRLHSPHFIVTWLHSLSAMFGLT